MVFWIGCALLVVSRTTSFFAVWQLILSVIVANTISPKCHNLFPKSFLKEREFQTPDISQTSFSQEREFQTPDISPTSFIQEREFQTPDISQTSFSQEREFQTPDISPTSFIQKRESFKRRIYRKPPLSKKHNST